MPGGTGVTLSFANGDYCDGCVSTRSTKINIKCDKTKTDTNLGNIEVDLPESGINVPVFGQCIQLYLTSLALPRPPHQVNPKYSLTFSHASGCPGYDPAASPGAAPGTSAGISPGSVMLIIIIIPFGVYMIAGALIQRLKFGRTGLEMLPNSPFWRSLPGLVGVRVDSYNTVHSNPIRTGWLQVFD